MGQAAKSNIASIGDNGREEQIQELIIQYVGTRKKSQELNDERAGIRKQVKELKLDTTEFQNQIRKAESDLKKREGAEETAKEISAIIAKLDPAALWDFVFEREEKKNKEREEKKAAKDKAKSDKNPRTGKTAE